MSAEKKFFKIARIYCAWAGWPFAIAGGASALAAAGIYGEGEQGWDVFLISMMGFCFGVGMIVFSYLYHNSPETLTSPKLRYPDDPWRWRSTWETNSIHDRAWARLLSNWLIVLILNAVIWPVALIYLQRDLPLAGTVIVYFFLLIGVVQLLSVINRTRRVIRFGTTFLELGTLPAKRGGYLQATLKTKLRPGSGDEIQGKLECIRYEIKSQSRQRADDLTEILCSILFTAAFGNARSGHKELIFSLKIPIPTDAEDSGPRRAPWNRVVWKLTITGPKGYSCEFEVPIYGESAEHRLTASKINAGKDHKSSNHMTNYSISEPEFNLKIMVMSPIRRGCEKIRFQRYWPFVFYHEVMRTQSITKGFYPGMEFRVPSCPRDFVVPPAQIMKKLRFLNRPVRDPYGLILCTRQRNSGSVQTINQHEIKPATGL